MGRQAGDNNRGTIGREWEDNWKISGRQLGHRRQKDNVRQVEDKRETGQTSSRRKVKEKWETPWSRETFE